MTTLASCTQKKQVDGEYDFIIYASDSDNDNLSNNPIVAKYHIEYAGCKTVSDTLIKKDSKYYFSDKSSDYLILTDSAYGLTYTEGYFLNYFECEGEKQIDISWSMTTINGTLSNSGISETPLDGLIEYGFIINGWK